MESNASTNEAWEARLRVGLPKSGEPSIPDAFLAANEAPPMDEGELRSLPGESLSFDINVPHETLADLSPKLLYSNIEEDTYEDLPELYGFNQTFKGEAIFSIQPKIPKGLPRLYVYANIDYDRGCPSCGEGSDVNRSWTYSANLEALVKFIWTADQFHNVFK